MLTVLSLETPSICRRATSSLGSAASTRAGWSGPEPSTCTWTRVAPSMTWLLVSTSPPEVSTMPVPAATPSIRVEVTSTMPGSTWAAVAEVSTEPPDPAAPPGTAPPGRFPAEPLGKSPEKGPVPLEEPSPDGTEGETAVDEPGWTSTVCPWSTIAAAVATARTPALTAMPSDRCGGPEGGVHPGALQDAAPQARPVLVLSVPAAGGGGQDGLAGPASDPGSGVVGGQVAPLSMGRSSSHNLADGLPVTGSAPAGGSSVTRGPGCAAARPRRAASGGSRRRAAPAWCSSSPGRRALRG
jgi:hypothetical protein